MSKTFDIQEYNKLSAEALGLRLSPHHTNLYWLSNTSTQRPNYTRWQPDKDANQREMIEDWLIKEKECWIKYTHYFELTECEIGPIPNKVQPEFYDSINTEDKSKSIAFAKAFMEYLTSQEDKI